MAYDMYQERILQHYRSPRNFGPLESPTASGEESNPLCGDHITVQFKLGASGETVDEVRFTGDGCAISMASASMLTERIRGRPLSEVQHLTQDEVVALLGISLSPVRIKCALTGFSALGKALAQTRSTAGPAR
ncbi:MAG: iron-sulfur cluster assembly scaffold protein [Thermoplasmata archaeon]